jgi:hypothetical protein
MGLIVFTGNGVSKNVGIGFNSKLNDVGGGNPTAAQNAAQRPADPTHRNNCSSLVHLAAQLR